MFLLEYLFQGAISGPAKNDDSTTSTSHVRQRNSVRANNTNVVFLYVQHNVDVLLLVVICVSLCGTILSISDNMSDFIVHYSFFSLLVQTKNWLRALVTRINSLNAGFCRNHSEIFTQKSYIVYEADRKKIIKGLFILNFIFLPKQLF